MRHLLKTTEGKNDETYTPEWLFDKLQILFDLDVASHENVSHVPAKSKLTQTQCGLTTPWHGNVWMNPPYSKPKLWVEKFIQHAHGIALLPTSTGKWQIDLWSDKRNAWVMLEPMKFRGYTTALPTRCYLIAYGTNNIAALQNFGQVRQ